MPTFRVQITDKARDEFLRQPPLSVGQVAKQRLLEALSSGITPHLVRSNRAISLWADGNEFARLVAGAALHGFSSAEQFAAALIHAVHLRVDPTAAEAEPPLVIQAPEPPVEVRTRSIRVALERDRRLKQWIDLRLPTRTDPAIGREYITVGGAELRLRGSWAPGLPLLTIAVAPSDSLEQALAIIRSALRLFGERSLADPNEMIAVRRVGAGPTPKSAKFQFEALHRAADGSSIRKSHTYLLPVSLMREIDGQQWMAAWVVNKKLMQRHVNDCDADRFVSGVNRRMRAVDAIFEQLAPLVEAAAR